MDKILGLDPSITAFGWCLAAPKPVPPEAWVSGTYRPEGLSDLGLWFGELLARERPDMIVCEQPLQVIMMYGKKQLIHLPSGGSMLTPNASQTVLWKIEGMIIGIAALCQCPVLMVPPKTWRASILGDGNLDRDIAKARAKRACDMMGMKIRSVDEAEASCVALFGLGSIEWRDVIRRKTLMADSPTLQQ